MKSFCEDNEIKLSFCERLLSKTNGQVEATDKTIVKILMKKVKVNPKDWVDIFPEDMWAYQTSVKNPTSQSPFTLAFGLEVVTPSELIWPTARILGYEEDNNEELLVEANDTWDQMCEDAIKRGVKWAMRKYYNT